MSHVLISDLVKPCLFICFGYCVTGHFKRLPCSHVDGKSLRLRLNEDMHFVD